MDKVKALELLKMASNRNEARALWMADRDKNKNFVDYLKELGFDVDGKDVNYLLWLAYWLGRQHGEHRLIANARIDLSRCIEGKERRSLDKILLSALTDYYHI